MTHYKSTDHGFEYGAATVTRMIEIQGQVMIRVGGAGDRYVDIYVSPTGQSVRTFVSGHGEQARAKVRP